MAEPAVPLRRLAAVAGLAEALKVGLVEGGATSRHGPDVINVGRAVRA
jgi:hypothetical protein